MIPDGGGWKVLAHAGSDAAARAPDASERTTADRAVQSDQLQSAGRTGLERSRVRVVFPSGRRAAYERQHSVAMVPLKLGEQVVGVLRLDGPMGETPFREQPAQLLAAVASEAALALQRTELARDAAHAQALQEADELKTALLNSVSHDLRTPLASIIAAAGSLRQTDVKWTDQERQDFAEAIEQEAQRLNGIVGNLLDMSRIESGGLRPDKGLYDLGTLIEDVVARLQPLLEGHVVQTDVPNDLPPVPLDYVQIDEVLTNLIENAAKYTPPGTQIDVSAALDGDTVTVEIADNGPGIDPGALSRIFEAFFRANGSRVRGTGLGLAVAKGLVEAHGGSIEAQNRPGGGALFRFTLPMSESMLPVPVEGTSYAV
jgi:two-component system sensor histidine kinase KdpD